jgi:hypothetical protein
MQPFDSHPLRRDQATKGNHDCRVVENGPKTHRGQRGMDVEGTLWKPIFQSVASTILGSRTHTHTNWPLAWYSCLPSGSTFVVAMLIGMPARPPLPFHNPDKSHASASFVGPPTSPALLRLAAPSQMGWAANPWKSAVVNDPVDHPLAHSSAYNATHKKFTVRSRSHTRTQCKCHSHTRTPHEVHTHTRSPP